MSNLQTVLWLSNMANNPPTVEEFIEFVTGTKCEEGLKYYLRLKSESASNVYVLSNAIMTYMGYSVSKTSLANYTHRLHTDITHMDGYYRLTRQQIYDKYGHGITDKLPNNRKLVFYVVTRDCLLKLFKRAKTGIGYKIRQCEKYIIPSYISTMKILAYMPKEL